MPKLTLQLRKQITQAQKDLTKTTHYTNSNTFEEPPFLIAQHPKGHHVIIPNLENTNRPEELTETQAIELLTILQATIQETHKLNNP